MVLKLSKESGRLLKSRIVLVTFSFLFCLIIELAARIGASAKNFRFIYFTYYKNLRKSNVYL